MMSMDDSHVVRVPSNCISSLASCSSGVEGAAPFDCCDEMTSSSTKSLSSRLSGVSQSSSSSRTLRARRVREGVGGGWGVQLSYLRAQS